MSTFKHQCLFISVSWCAQVAVSYSEVLGLSPSESLSPLLMRPGARNAVPAKLEQLVARIAALPLPKLPMRASEAARTLDGAMLRLPVVGCCSRACTNCELPSELGLPLRLCSGCRVARYCSPECQAAAWAGHKRVCRVLCTEGRGRARCGIQVCCICLLLEVSLSLGLPRAAQVQAAAFGLRVCILLLGLSC